MLATTFDPALLSFSGHETFILRSHWLKKAYDLLRSQPDLFSLEDAFVRLGVGKNMAHSIRYWGRVCHVFERSEDGTSYRPTWLGDALLADSGWDPFLVTPTSRWLLHWQICAGSAAVFTWFFTFNLLRRGEFSSSQLAQQVHHVVAQLGAKLPSAATLGRDIDCMLRCYVRPDATLRGAPLEDALQCPLHDLELIQLLPGQGTYRLAGGAHPDLPDQLVALAAWYQARHLGRATLAFNELAYAERSPGRVFRLDEDALLTRLLHMEQITHGQATFSESGGIRQLAWRNLEDAAYPRALLQAAFAQERHYV
ncbi:hypothetical protein OSCT_2514 [Oscillochloris trichoides DG-6]|uniref:DUF4007 domain-containing protein n=1 Tax=Oscillochloris trichoides DG-6 TaxID=765420 RepID=E1IGR3_9CHLR|nr:DUF4007 family protein [Oscillochloris trichoides]EFO79650.1 hypothetical protein OSCT_2514 [Oscillochloris trichoides DG-6]